MTGNGENGQNGKEHKMKSEAKGRNLRQENEDLRAENIQLKSEREEARAVARELWAANNFLRHQIYLLHTGKPEMDSNAALIAYRKK
jgi:cell division protein FtsB